MLPFMFIVLVFISSSCGENPAVQFILTNKGLQYGKHVGAGWIQDKLAAVTLPEISGEIYIIFGHLHYKLTDVTITKCDFPEPVVEFYKDVTGFKTSIPGLSIAVTGDWMTEFGIIQSSGSFNMAVFSVDVTSVVELGTDPDRRLSVTSVGCDAQVGGVDMQFSGGVSWIYNHFEELYNERIKEEMKEKICQYVEESIVNLESHLQAMNVSFDVNQDIAVDLPLTGVPAIGASSVNVGFKGEFYSTKTHADPPFKPQQFTVPEQLNYMLSLGISEFTLNSASYGYYSAGLLQRVINDSMIPSYSPVRLNTSSMGPFIPKLPELYPGLLMTLQVYATDVPLFSFQPGAVQLDLNVDIKAFAIQPNGTQTPLFKLNAGSTFNAKVWTADGRLKASVGLTNLTLTLASSEIGPFKTDALQQLAKMGATAAIAKANEWLGKGIELPRMKHAELVNTVLEVEKGFIAIYADAQVLQKEGDLN